MDEFRYQFKTTDELVTYVQEQVVLTEEATIILGVSRQRLHDLRKQERIVPLVEGKQGAIYWRAELEVLAKELQQKRGKEV